MISIISNCKYGVGQTGVKPHCIHAHTGRARGGGVGRGRKRRKGVYPAKQGKIYRDCSSSQICTIQENKSVKSCHFVLVLVRFFSCRRNASRTQRKKREQSATVQHKQQEQEASGRAERSQDRETSTPYHPRFHDRKGYRKPSTTEWGRRHQTSLAETRQEVTDHNTSQSGKYIYIDYKRTLETTPAVCVTSCCNLLLLTYGDPSSTIRGKCGTGCRTTS